MRARSSGSLDEFTDNRIDEPGFALPYVPACARVKSIRALLPRSKTRVYFGDEGCCPAGLLFDLSSRIVRPETGVAVA
jgi:hypothetical protein